jgi:hypothetical protein
MMRLKGCEDCGGDLNWDELEKEWVCLQSGHRTPDKDRASRPFAGDRDTHYTEPVTPEGVTVRFTVYIHTARLTAHPNDGLQQAIIEMLLIRRATRANKNHQSWRIEYLDLGQYRMMAGSLGRTGGFNVVAEKAKEELAKRNIDWGDVKGWTSRFQAPSDRVGFKKRPAGRPRVLSTA